MRARLTAAAGVIALLALRLASAMARSLRRPG